MHVHTKLAEPKARQSQHGCGWLRRRQPEQRLWRDPGGEAAEPKARQSQHGQIVPVMAALLVLMAVLALGLARLGIAVVHEARAQSAADGVALAIVVQPRADAARIAQMVAARNGATVDSVQWVGDDVRVTVHVAQATGHARARAVQASVPGVP